MTHHDRPTCPTCSRPGVLTWGVEVYPPRPDLCDLPFWACMRCETWVGCHPNTTNPLGRMANASTRILKHHAHLAFDPLWQSGRMTRSQAYSWLRCQLGLVAQECHIGSLSDVDLRRTITLCQHEQARRDFDA